METGTQNEDILSSEKTNIKDRILVHVQDSEHGETIKGGNDAGEDVKGFSNEIDLASPIALIAYTPSHTVTDLANTHRRYKSNDPREIYKNAEKESAPFLKQKAAEKEELQKLMMKENKKGLMKGKK